MTILQSAGVCVNSLLRFTRRSADSAFAGARSGPVTAEVGSAVDSVSGGRYVDQIFGPMSEERRQLKRYKVIQVATGAVGTHSLRTILGRPDMELVGLLAFSPDKVGKDAGEIVGGKSVGVCATDDFDEVLSRTLMQCLSMHLETPWIREQLSIEYAVCWNRERTSAPPR